MINIATLAKLENSSIPLHVQLAHGIADDFHARELLEQAFDYAAAAEEFKFHASLAYVAYVGFDAARAYAREHWADSRDPARQYFTRIITLAQRAHAAGKGPRIAEIRQFRELAELAGPAPARQKKAASEPAADESTPVTDAATLPTDTMGPLLAAIGLLDDIAQAATIDRTALQAAIGMVKAAAATHA